MNLSGLLTRHYFLTWVMMITSIFAFGVSIRYYHRHKGLKVFTYYILFSMVEDWAAIYSDLGNHEIPFRAHLSGLISNMFMLTEFIICATFILRFVSSRRRRRIIRVNCLIFLVLLLRVLIKYPESFLLSAFFIAESLFLILPCLLYFYDLLANVYLEPLKNQPAFWIITGFLFLNTCGLMLLTVRGYLGKYDEAAYSLNYILYTILFLLMIRAYLCKPIPQP